MNSITKLIFMKLKGTITGTKRIGDTYYICYTVNNNDVGHHDNCEMVNKAFYNSHAVGDKIDCMIDLKVFDDGHEDCKIWLVR